MHTEKKHILTVQEHAFALSHAQTGYSRPLSVTRDPDHRAAADSAVADLFPWSVKAKFHSKFPCTFYTTHKNCRTLPKCLQLHVYQSRGYFILQEQLLHSN